MQMHKNEKGLMLLPLVLGTMILAVSLVAAQLAYSTSALKSSNAFSAPASLEGCGGSVGIVDESYSTNAGVEHAIWRILYENGFITLFSPEAPSINDELTINDCPVPVTITQIFPEGYGEGGVTTPAKEVRVEKTVSHPSFPSAGNHVVTYQITIENIGLEPYTIKRIEDQLPSGLAYKDSTSGLTSNAPSEEFAAGAWYLAWAPLSVTLYPGEITSLDFMAEGYLEEGTYWNQALVMESPSTDLCRSTGLTAPIEVGGNSNSYQTSVLEIEKVGDPASVHQGDTVTYTIRLRAPDVAHNVGVAKIFDKMPNNFTYVPGSTTSTFDFTGDPSITQDNNRQTLEWSGMTGLSGGVGIEWQELSFQAVANSSAGIKSNKVWVKTVNDQLQNLSCYGTTETAPVDVLAQYEVIVVSGNTIAYVTLEQSSDTVTITSKQVTTQ